jgi:hypothetical protein
MEWAYHRTNELWDEVVKHKDIPYSVWVGMFSNIMGRLVQGTADSPDEGIEIADEMMGAMQLILYVALKERFGTETLGEVQWQQ